MRLTTLILLASLIQVSASTRAQNITILKESISLRDAFSQIRKQTGYIVISQSEKIDRNKRISLNLRNASLETAMTRILQEENVTFAIEDKSIVLMPKPSLIANLMRMFVAVDVKGKVLDESSKPIPGATVSIKGTKKNTVSDAEGSFAINAAVNDILVISIIGYETKEVIVTSDSNISITLKVATTELAQVVVTALGIKREEKSLGYAVQKVSGNSLTSTKGVNIATSLTGKVAGLNIQNSTEFAAIPSIRLRGVEALLVIDGVPHSSSDVTLDNISPDDIESIDVLKGATASALYGNRGGNGAIMITTKRGNKDGALDIAVNSSSMFSAGFLAFPKVQTGYSSGGGGKYGVGDYVWGDKLDIGRTAKQYNPSTYQFEDMPLVSKGKDNLANFLQRGIILNNNISIAQSGKNGGFRASLTDVRNRGQYPNTKLNKVIASISGDIKAGDFTLDAGFTFNKRFYPNNIGAGYGAGGYLYNLLIWSGTEYDIRDYKNYWVAGKENVLQNWMENTWYDNPYFIANEILRGDNYNLTNSYVNANYQIKPWLKAVLRSGIDTYSQTIQWRNSISAVGGWNKKGYYSITKSDAFTTNNDLMLLSENKFGKFQVNGLIGGGIFYREHSSLNTETQNGITVPGFYSIAASVDPVKSTPGAYKKQVNSLYAKAGISYGNFAFIDLTGRNDWSSTLAASERSYFYPSVSGSLVFSELLKLPSWISMAKLRGSWTKTKLDADVYAINNSYSISTNVWNGASSSSFPTTIRGADILPQTNRTYEYGAGFFFLKNRIRFDVAYFNNLYYNQIISSTVSSASGVGKVLINTKEELERKGVELTLEGTVVKNDGFSWDLGLNWSTNRRYYAALDPIYSTKKQWVTKGSRYDWVSGNSWDKSPDGQPILQNGFPIRSQQETIQGYSDPDWIWGLNNTFRYKNFTLNFSFDGRVGGTAYSNMIHYMWSSGTHIDSDNNWRYDEVVNGKKSFVANGVKVVSGTTTRDVFGNILTDTRVFEPNTTAVSYETYVRNSQGTQNYFKQTFFKLRELSLTYMLPTKLVKNIGMKNASVGFIGQNMLLWTKDWKYSDPDVGGDNLNSPSVRYMGFNIKATF
ncbi:SusC/RagA family TonB-linked outer membrane protein [Pedobacter africanus]|uniref:TonB-linked SusC/RagA family outer membrane protein n=1 Tax=Pedobacter africanus TaxID=151894 RepID=A0ACC6KV95_9SPHI|nr:SusC/RagA family TonB-linked outer membrane protein [Pedobacter africanus]MDR6783162.1 TonB-linked SusC/RagA family outer membrane protein [Pedobacter africanus]